VVETVAWDGLKNGVTETARCPWLNEVLTGTLILGCGL
jgi:hypothetical protein